MSLHDWIDRAWTTLMPSRSQVTSHAHAGALAPSEGVPGWMWWAGGIATAGLVAGAIHTHKTRKEREKVTKRTVHVSKGVRALTAAEQKVLQEKADAVQRDAAERKEKAEKKAAAKERSEEWYALQREKHAREHALNVCKKENATRVAQGLEPLPVPVFGPPPRPSWVRAAAPGTPGGGKGKGKKKKDAPVAVPTPAGGPARGASVTGDVVELDAPVPVEAVTVEATPSASETYWVGGTGQRARPRGGPTMTTAVIPDPKTGQAVPVPYEAMRGQKVARRLIRVEETRRAPLPGGRSPGLVGPPPPPLPEKPSKSALEEDIEKMEKHASKRPSAESEEMAYLDLVVARKLRHPISLANLPPEKRAAACDYIRSKDPACAAELEAAFADPELMAEWDARRRGGRDAAPSLGTSTTGKEWTWDTCVGETREFGGEPYKPPFEFQKKGRGER